MLSSLLLVKKKDKITAILVFFLLKCQYMDPYSYNYASVWNGIFLNTSKYIPVQFFVPLITTSEEATAQTNIVATCWNRCKQVVLPAATIASSIPCFS